MATPPKSPRAAKTADRAGAGVAAARIRLGQVFRAESGDYFLLLGTVLFLVVLGLVMVFSSSLVQSKIEEDDFLVQAGRQGLWALFGVPIMLFASRVPERVWMRLAWPALVLSCAMQLLVVATPLGIEIGGNTNWLAIGSFQFQPSEAIKVALVLWLGLIVTKKQDRMGDFVHGIVPILLVGGGAIGLVLLGGDLGTVMVMAAMLLGALFLIGVRLRLLLIPMVLGAVVFGIVAVSSDSRMRRISSFLQENCTTIDQADCWQVQHGTFALANGGIFGVGLGNSAAKWSWLPAADNDFIFAIIGEELGLIGAIVVLGLFVLLAIAFARVLRSAKTPFARAATAAVMVWVIVQACVNIGVVLKVFPVLGVPLPLVSAGGTALLTTLFAIGIVLSVARDPEAAARAAARLQARRAARSGQPAPSPAPVAPAPALRAVPAPAAGGRRTPGQRGAGATPGTPRASARTSRPAPERGER
ncbi:putative lipid II flippase FtsW [Agromyces sp. G08B096]|uniref:Probable peptidoglycan glycosyltransferase FtsW n=1 Tax=Agromyces sp. G08B096 TaxID=3156399 RepID=A0AAU7W4D8_9MICO